MKRQNSRRDPRRNFRKDPRRNAKNYRESEVISRLAAGEILSTYGQVSDSGGWRLGAVIHKLKAKGFNIESFYKKGFGRCAFYRLEPEDNRQFDIFGFSLGKPAPTRTGEGQ